MLRKIVYSLSALTILSACDGGSSASDPAPAINYEMGSFVDSPVAGLAYKTKTVSGLTDEHGQFRYQKGELVEFSIGGIHLGTAEGQEIITPFNLLGAAPLTNELSITSTLQSDAVTSFDRVINISTLLQSLDSDGNPENGIDLGNADSVFSESDLDFNVKAGQFENQQTFQDALAKMNIDSHRTFIEAARHLYDSLDIEIESSLVGSVLSQDNKQAKNLSTYTYNSNRLLESKETDFGNDGIVDQILTYTYDSKNRLVQTFDSTSEIMETNTYDEFDNILTKEIDHPIETNDSMQSFTYLGSLLTKLETDFGNDGSVDLTTDYEYHENGKLARHTVSRAGTVSISITTYNYAGERISALIEDTNGDGEPDSSINYTYDVRGNVLSQLTSRFGQTIVSRFKYNTNNQLIRFERDDNQDGLPEYIEAYKYDSKGNRTEYKKDLNADDNWDAITQYSYDSFGNRTQMIEDSDGNGIVDKVWGADYHAAILANPWQNISAQL